MRAIVLLTISNIFMTFAWYGHLKYRNEALWKVIMASWGIAFFEYCFQVPANRIGSYQFNAAQLKTIQEIITLSIFPVFSIFYLGDKFKWNHGVGFAFIAIQVMCTGGQTSTSCLRAKCKSGGGSSAIPIGSAMVFRGSSA